MQRERYENTPAKSREWYPLFAGQFRAAIVYGGGLVLLDTQIFDGAVLLTLGPTGLSTMLGATELDSRVVVSLRDASAERSLQKILHPGFVSQVDRLGWPEATLRRRRRAWVDAIEDDRFTKEVREADFDFDRALSARLEEAGSTFPWSSDHGSIRIRLKAVYTRSGAHEVVEHSDLDAPGRAALLEWWESAYMDVISLQHDAAWMDSEPGGVGSRPMPGDGPSSKDTGVERLRASDPIPNSVIRSLARMSGGEFAAVVGGGSDLFARLHGKAGLRNRVRVGLFLLDATRSPTPLVSLLFTALRILSWALIVVFIVAPPQSWWGAPLVIFAALIQLPFFDIVNFGRYFGSRSRAYMRRPIRR